MSLVKVIKVQPVADDYLVLIRRFPLRPIRTRQAFESAGMLLDELVGKKDLTAGQQDYLDGLVRFVRDYEANAFGNKLRKLTPIQVLKHLMEENQMNTSDLGAVLGSRGLASEVLNGKRALSKTLIGKLVRRFRVEPALFLDLRLGE